MEREYLDRKTNSSTTKHSFGSGLLGKDDKKTGVEKDLRENNRIRSKAMALEIVFITLTVAFFLHSIYTLVAGNIIGVVTSVIVTVMWWRFAGIYLNKLRECRKKEIYLKDRCTKILIEDESWGGTTHLDGLIQENVVSLLKSLPIGGSWIPTCGIFERTGDIEVTLTARVHCPDVNINNCIIRVQFIVEGMGWVFRIADDVKEVGTVVKTSL